MINVADLELKPVPFGEEGEPQPSFALAMEIDAGRIQHGVWESGPGELEFRFEWHETVYVLDGRAEIENMGTKQKFVLSPGSLMSFERGSHWRWRVPWKIKKVFTVVCES